MRTRFTFMLGLLLVASGSICTADPAVVNNRPFSLVRAYYDGGAPVPGVLTFASRPGPNGPQLDADAFATCPSGEVNPVVRGAKLTVQLPWSPRLPAFFRPRPLVQTDAQIATQWPALAFPPGTTFTLDVTVTCLVVRPIGFDTHIDRYVWRIVATPDSLLALIDLLFTPPGGAAPAITSTQTYLDLKSAALKIKIQASLAPSAVQRSITAMELQVAADAVAGKVVRTPHFDGPRLLLEELEGLAGTLP